MHTFSFLMVDLLWTMSPSDFVQTSNANATSPDIDVFYPPPLSNPSTKIRLLNIHPGGDDEDIVCEMGIFTFEADEVVDEVCGMTIFSAINIAPPYVAISYTWGSQENPRTILINGRPANVGQNCHYALW